MNKLTVLLLISLIFISCKDNTTSEEAAQQDQSTSREAQESRSTYAEISVKKGGEWQGQQYVGGEFENTDRVELPESHTDHSYYIRYEGPGWENEQIAYRLYLDWRNAIDIFGKKTDSLVLPFVGQEGFDSYHNEAPWGMDILKAGESLGIGGFGRYVNDTVAHFRNVSQTVAEVSNGADRSTVELSYSDWETGDTTIDLEAELTIFPEGRHTRAVLNPSETIEGLCTGIVKFEGIPLMESGNTQGNWKYIATYGAQTLVNETDKLGLAIFYKIDEVQSVVAGKDDHLVIFNPTSESVTYYFLGAWEGEPNGIQSEDAFREYLESSLESLNQNDEL